jgi:S1-C subfamily serine protease
MTKNLSAKILSSMLALSLLGAACTKSSPPPASSPQATALSGSTLPPLDPSRDPIVQVVDRVRPAVVNVTTDTLTMTAFGSQTGQVVGTGFIIRSDGVIVTNYHVVEGAQKITVVTPAPDSRRFEARVIGGDSTADLAVLKVDGKGLPTVPLGNSSQLELGQQVVALGYALALKGGPTVTTGIVSAMGRVIQAQDPNYQPGGSTPGGTRTYRDVIQTDAAINPGNSGGPLVNLAGEVVGINTAGAGQAENIGFSIAIDAAKPTIQRAVENPNAPVAFMGVVSQTVSASLAYQFDLPVKEGAYVVEVTSGGPADEAGINTGDVITEFDGTKVTSADQLGNLIHEHQPGDQVDVVVETGSGPETKTATLGTNPLP